MRIHGSTHAFFKNVSGRTVNIVKLVFIVTGRLKKAPEEAYMIERGRELLISALCTNGNLGLNSTSDI